MVINTHESCTKDAENGRYTYDGNGTLLKHLGYMLPELNYGINVVHGLYEHGISRTHVGEVDWVTVAKCFEINEHAASIPTPIRVIHVMRGIASVARRSFNTGVGSSLNAGPLPTYLASVGTLLCDVSRLQYADFVEAMEDGRVRPASVGMEDGSYNSSALNFELTYCLTDLLEGPPYTMEDDQEEQSSQSSAPAVVKIHDAHERHRQLQAVMLT